MTDLNDEQTLRVAALDCVLHYYRGVSTDEMPETLDLLAMAEWVLDGTAELAIRAVDLAERRNHDLYGERGRP